MIEAGRSQYMEFVAAEPLQHSAARIAAQELRQLVQAATSRMRVATRALADQGHESPSILIDEAADLLDRAASLVHQLAPTKSHAEPAPATVLVQQLIVAAGNRMRRTLGGAIRLQTCVSSGTPAVRCPPRLLEDILFRLAIMARGAMPDGGVLLIESRTRQAHDSQPQRTIVYVTVTATGRDQAQAVRPERMVRVGSREEPDCAWSPGFRDVRRLVEEIGGVAELEQLPSGGSCVRLRLPGCADRS